MKSRWGRRLVGLFVLLVVSGVGSSAIASETGPGRAGDAGRVTIAVVPEGITVRDLDRIRPAGIGLMNPGLGHVPAKQTWLDVSQGSRVFDDNYGRSLGPVHAGQDRVYGWERVQERARTASLPIRPGLLATTLASAGHRTGATEEADLPALAAARISGRLDRTGPQCPGPNCRFDLTITEVSLAGAGELAHERRAGELLIVVESPPAEAGDQLAIAIAGPGYHGMLRSPSTRTDGYVLATDLGPTVLAHLGLDAPGAMSGLPIEAGGRVDYEHLDELEGRYEQVGKRRGAALGAPLLLWVGLSAVAIVATRGKLARTALTLLCLSVVLLPAALLLTAAITPSLGVERAIATVLPVATAALLSRWLPAHRALAAACGVTVLAYAIDMLAGSPLTPRAVIGPNPGLGARFYGIGNELESTLMVLTSVGVGAGLTAVTSGRAQVSRRRAAWAFLITGAAATVIFASGWFGADVGAAIVFPVAAVVAAAFALGRPRLAWLALLAAVVGLVVIAVIDLATGGETHFLRSVLGGADDSFDSVLLHRLEATAESFTRVSRIPATLVAFALIGVAIWKRATVRRWLDTTPDLAAGMVGAAAGSLVGAISNDSGVLFIQVGVLYLALILAFVWAAGRRWG